MAYDKSAVQSFNGQLYSYLFKDQVTGFVTTLSDFVSSSLITISTPTFSLNENLAQTSTPSTLSFHPNIYYPLASNTTSSAQISGTTLTVLSSFLTFSDKTFLLLWPFAP